ncbi:hypothetical protein ACLOJK_019426 [Asimina triloba]
MEDAATTVDRAEIEEDDAARITAACRSSGKRMGFWGVIVGCCSSDRSSMGIDRRRCARHRLLPDRVVASPLDLVGDGEEGSGSDGFVATVHPYYRCAWEDDAATLPFALLDVDRCLIVPVIAA